MSTRLVRSYAYSFRRTTIFSPEAFPVTNADLIEPLKGSDDTVARKSLLARFQQARRNSAKRAEAAAEAEKEQAAVPLHVHRQVESESEDESNQDPDEALLLWHQSWANFFDEETRATTPRAPKRKGGLRRTASEYLRTPKRAKSERTPSRDHSSSESEGSSAPQTPSRPSRSAKTKVLSLREPTLGGKLRPGYPGTFDLDGAVPHWRERESVPKTPRKTPTRSYAELTQSKTPHKTPTRREAKVKTPCAEAEAINKTPQKTPRKRNASDVEVCDNDGFRYFTSKTHAATPAPFKSAFASDASRLCSFLRESLTVSRQPSGSLRASLRSGTKTRRRSDRSENSPAMGQRNQAW